MFFSMLSSLIDIYINQFLLITVIRMNELIIKKNSPYKNYFLFTSFVFPITFYFQCKHSYALLFVYFILNICYLLKKCLNKPINNVKSSIQ